MRFSTALIFTSTTAVLANGPGRGDDSGPGTGMTMWATTMGGTVYSISGTSLYPVTGLHATKTKGSDDMTTTGVRTYSMGHETESHKWNSTMSSYASTKMISVTSTPSVATAATVSVSTKASSTTTAAAQVTTNAAASFKWSAAAGLAAIAGLVLA